MRQDHRFPPARARLSAAAPSIDRWLPALLAAFAACCLSAARAADEGAATDPHWAYRPMRAVTPPPRDPNWGRTVIDAFIARGHRERKIRPAGRAPKTVLLRRAYYDLIGLPPPPSAVRAFLADASPQAFERVVDRLLASPQYGVRWGRHWLDLMRYAETNSYERDAAKPFAWRYRDYVIASFNRDKPYDAFVREQLAGDEYDPVTPEARVATGSLRLGIWDDEPVDRQQALYDDLDDIVTTTSQAFLGVNLGCARCHDHKIDPITQRDYYRFLAFFNGLTRYGVRSPSSVVQNSLRPLALPADIEAHRQRVAAYQRKLRLLRERMEEIERLVRADFSPVEEEDFKHRQHRVAILHKRVPRLLRQTQLDQYIALFDEHERWTRRPPAGLEQALCVTEIGVGPRETFVLIRGSVHGKGERVEPGVPTVLGGFSADSIVPTGQSSGRRRALAQWITSPDNRLTARVIVNRLWHYHFGRGIVATPNDFGYGGARPTHPELLDYLAQELIRGGWRLKRIHRLIMQSAAYQMSSAYDTEMARRDPTNDRWWRFEPRRLGAEAIRDSILAVTGQLNLQLGGPSVFVRIPAEVLAGQSRPGSGWGESPPQQAARRSIFIHVKRSLIPPILAAFDGPDTDASCPRRYVSTQPTQALLMLNSRFVQEQARTFAASLGRVPGSTTEARVAEGLWRVLQRPPRPPEVDRGVRFIERLTRRQQLARAEAYRYYCLVLLNLNEFLYLD